MDDQQNQKKSAYVVLTNPGIIDSPDKDHRYELIGYDVVIGSSVHSQIYLPPQVAESEHARLFLGKKGWVLRNLSSTYTVSVGDMIVGLYHFQKDGEAFSVGKAEFRFFFGDTSHSAYDDELYRRSVTDPLMQIHNRRAFDQFLRQAIDRCARANQPLAMIFFDIDHFKEQNTLLGHPGGDEVLRQVAKIIGSQVRKNEMLARTGGEELALILPEVNKERATEIAERIRTLVEKAPVVFQEHTVSITISAGVAIREQNMDNLAFIALADQKLYEAKHTGRNKVCS